MLVRHRLPLDPVDTAGGHVEEEVDEVVGQEVDLVDIEHAAVGGGQQAGQEATLTAGQRCGQVQRAGDAILGGAHRQLDERRLVPQQRGQPARQCGLGASLLAPEQHTADGRVDGVEDERQLHVVVADDGREGEPRQGGRASHRNRASSHPSASNNADRSTDNASSDASHRPRSDASSNRSVIDRSAHGFDCS